MSTTGMVMTVTDELLAEIAQELNRCKFSDDDDGDESWPSISGEAVSALTAELHRLRAENAELVKDAGRLEWMISEQCTMRVQNGTGSPLVYSLWWSTLGEGQINWHKSARDAIDTAMATQ